MANYLDSSVSFSKPDEAPNQNKYLEEASASGRPWGGNSFYDLAVSQLASFTGAKEVLLTQSCTSALELAAIGLGIEPGDEIICPSYTFVTTASAFSMRGAKPVFVDIEQATMNINPNDVQRAITKKTKAIVAMHYGGAACDVDRLRELSNDAGIFLVEDAAQGIDAYHSGKHLGTIGNLGCISFHGTKNLSSGEGGALLINETTSTEVTNRIKIAHEKGTDRSEFLRGHVDKYTWKGPGSSFIPSEFTAAVLLSQLENSRQIRERRFGYWQTYMAALEGTEFETLVLPNDTKSGNAHMFSILLPERIDRTMVIELMNKVGVFPTSHYEPLHVSPYVRKKWPSQPSLPVTEELAARILRLPMWSAKGLNVERVIDAFLDAVRGK